MVFLFTCEHATSRIPKAFAIEFYGKAKLLTSHRGWDKGADQVATGVAKVMKAAYIRGRHSRLLVDLNRTESHPQVVFLDDRRALLLACYHRPHWQKVEHWIDQHVALGCRVVHLGFHSFTPVLRGQVRNCAIGLLFDPQRRLESQFCKEWQRNLKRRSNWVIRRNYPYRGDMNGLVTELRKRYPAKSYLGIEVEMNQRILKTTGQILEMKSLLSATMPLTSAC